MKRKIEILIFIFILCKLNNDVLANDRCVYSNSEMMISNFKKEVFYACDYKYSLSIKDEGKHLPDKSDDDVKIINFLTLANRDYNFKAGFCENFDSLIGLSAKWEELELLDKNSFSKCTNLKALILTSNYLGEISENFLSQMTELTYLKIKITILQHISENAFSNLSGLEDLDMSFSFIRDLPDNIFNPLVGLKSLLLNGNKIRKLKVSWFEKLGKLKMLDLSRNKIDSLPKNVFTSLHDISFLQLDHNEISEIHADSFGSHKYSIYVQYNKINAVDNNFRKSFLVFEENPCVKPSGHFKGYNTEKCFENYKPRPEDEKNNRSTNSSTEYQMKCGKPEIAIPAIVGGSFIHRGTYPWHVALANKNGKYFCGGVLVTNKKVVTAAHCILGKDDSHHFLPRDVIVLLGVHNLSNSFEAGRVVVGVDKIEEHSAWVPKSKRFDADIAVLELTQEVQFSRFIQPVCLFDDLTSKIASIDVGEVVGFGKSEDESKLHENVPKVINMAIQKNEKCFLENYIFAQISSERTFCAGYANGTGICLGDSGSGLVVLHENVYYLRGIVSASLSKPTSKCDVNNYGLFTNAPLYTSWIHEYPK